VTATPWGATHSRGQISDLQVAEQIVGQGGVAIVSGCPFSRIVK